MLIIFNKPYGVITQFSPHEKHANLKDYIDVPHVYPAGRLDTDSEGLLILTDDGALQHRISHPNHKELKTYWVQVEGDVQEADLNPLKIGVDLGDFVTQPAEVKRIAEPSSIWVRNPPIRERQHIPTSWLEMNIIEGKNRQVRRMTANIGYPTLRLIRYAVGPHTIDNLPLGHWRQI